jgi:hypothetical protein
MFSIYRRLDSSTLVLFWLAAAALDLWTWGCAGMCLRWCVMAVDLMGRLMALKQMRLHCRAVVNVPVTLQMIDYAPAPSRLAAVYVHLQGAGMLLCLAAAATGFSRVMNKHNGPGTDEGHMAQLAQISLGRLAFNLLPVAPCGGFAVARLWHLPRWYGYGTAILLAAGGGWWRHVPAMVLGLTQLTLLGLSLDSGLYGRPARLDVERERARRNVCTHTWKAVAWYIVMVGSAAALYKHL